MRKRIGVIAGTPFMFKHLTRREQVRTIGRRWAKYVERTKPPSEEEVMRHLHPKHRRVA